MTRRPYPKNRKGRVYRRASLQELFDRHVVRLDGCWAWSAKRHPFGYGTMQSGGRYLLAHRVSWELHNGPIPAGTHVLHRCDNPICSRPDHLFLGTHADNMRDKAVKGRQFRPSGERNGMVKLTDSAVSEIRELRASGKYLLREIAALYGCSVPTVSEIVNRRKRAAP